MCVTREHYDSCSIHRRGTTGLWYEKHCDTAAAAMTTTHSVSAFWSHHRSCTLPFHFRLLCALLVHWFLPACLATLPLLQHWLWLPFTLPLLLLCPPSADVSENNARFKPSLLMSQGEHQWWPGPALHSDLGLAMVSKPGPAFGPGTQHAHGHVFDFQTHGSTERCC